MNIGLIMVSGIRYQVELCLHNLSEFLSHLFAFRKIQKLNHRLVHQESGHD